MKEKNDCERDYIKEAFDKLYERVMPYIDLTQFSDADTAFKELDRKVHSEIYILKKRLAESDRAVDAGLTRSEVDRERISDLEQRLNHERKHGEDLADINGQLASDNTDLKARLTFLASSRINWRGRAQHAEKRVADLNEKIHDLEEENANLRETPFDTLEALKKENSELRNGNKALNAMCESRLSALFEARKNAEQYKKSFMEHYEENDRLRGVVNTLEKEINTLKKKIHELEEENIHKRPWHGDGNAMTGAWTCCESLSEAIEFQNKKIEELEAEKARLKEAYDIHETTIERLKLLLTQQDEIDALKKENSELRAHNEDLSYGHEFKFGDKVYVPWSDAPYMYIKTSMMYNTRTKALVYVGKTQHLKWFGERFEIK